MERKLGEVFTYNGNEYKVCEDNNIDYICNQCAFNGINCDTIKCIRGNCTISSRTDNTQVFYKQINNEIMNKDSGNVVYPTFNTNNSLNELHIECPEGYSIDVEHSDLSKGIIKFKNDNITLEDIYKDDNTDYVANLVILSENKFFNKLLCIARLIDIANYYNKGWKPDWKNPDSLKFYIWYDTLREKYDIEFCGGSVRNDVYFKNKKDAQAVIDNPNFRSILNAIYKD